MDTDLLTERLHHLCDAAPVPPTAPADDVRRGRRRLRRNRVLAIAGTATAVAVLAGAGFAATGSTSTADRTAEPPVAGQPVPERSVPQGEIDEAQLAEILTGLAEQAEAEAGASLTLDKLQAMVDVVKANPSNPTMRRVAIDGARSWRSAGAAGCPANWTCKDVAVEGASRARWAASGAVWQLVVDFPSGVVILTGNAASERAADLAYRTD
ncbi:MULTISPECIES: hypothetical protein [Nocardioides]|uniref:Uncharacterized protein n=1 Tax=Nocardioides vastitatis TaxID=2568655 RepID=A0ABW0ZGE4_9ACTN|nr:hypothetical protein [Nocardioides sp.]THI94746.1 hypothetical protein E7Z54_19860 [Nocardioides sp.]